MDRQRNGLIRLVELGYGWFVLLLFRAYWGWQFFLTGKGKLMTHEHVTSFFASLGVPDPDLTAWFVAGLECFGGVLLLVGFASRPVGMLLTINMIVAYLAVEEDRVKVFNIFSDPTPFLSADPFFFLLAALLVFCFGPGLISIDGIIRVTLAGRTEKAHHK